MHQPPEIPDPHREHPAPARRSMGVVVRVIFMINVAVFLAWWWPGAASRFLVDHFLVSWPHLLEGRVWVLVTSVFSHNLAIHLMVNMIVLLSFGLPMELIMGRMRFLRFYLAAGVVASLAHALTSRFMVGEPEIPALGASGALAGVLLLFSFSFPKARVLMFFIVPLPAIFAALAFIAIDVWGLWAQATGESSLPIGHGAHLGGALVGIIYYLWHGRELRERGAAFQALRGAAGGRPDIGRDHDVG